MKELRTLIRQVIKEARTKHPGDLSQNEILGLVNYVLGGDGVFDFSEKFAGSHAEILHRSESGKFSTKSKSGRAAGSGWNEPRGKAKQITDQMSSLAVPAASRRFGFEFIDTNDRPDYINYLIGDRPVAIEYTGELTKAEAESLSSNQDAMKFISREDISHDNFNLSSKELDQLEKIKVKLGSPKLKRAELRDIGSTVSNLVISSVSQSLLGGPIEGLMVQTSDKTFKIPNPEYADIQRLQSPLYAMFSGRGGVSKKEIKSRVLKADFGDRLLQDMIKYLESISDLPSGFRTFFSEPEAESLLDLLDSAVAGNNSDALDLYNRFNRRINAQSKWVNTE